LAIAVAEDVPYLLVGIGLVAFSFLNVRYELTRRWIKRLGSLGSFPDTKFARVFYGSIASVFALVIGLGWTFGAMNLLLHRAGH
jgi:hypothetical protein